MAINFALDQLGKQYVWGGHGPDVYDCSGLVSAAWAKAGVRFTPQTEAMYRELPHVDHPQPGPHVPPRTHADGAQRRPDP